MGRSCRGKCEMLKAITVPNRQRYELGHKRCTVCGLYFTIPNSRCPCCNVVLRTRARGKNSHE